MEIFLDKLNGLRAFFPILSNAQTCITGIKFHFYALYCCFIKIESDLNGWKHGMNASFITNPADGKLERKTFKINYMGDTVKEVIN